MNLKHLPPPGRRSRLLGDEGCGRPRPLQRPVGWKRRRAPVRLVEVDVKSPRPVGEDPLLRDEAVVAAAPSALVWNVHGALVRTARLVVVIGDGVMLRLPAGKAKEERQLTFKKKHFNEFYLTAEFIFVKEGDLICICLFVFGGRKQTNSIFKCRPQLTIMIKKKSKIGKQSFNK